MQRSRCGARCTAPLALLRPATTRPRVGPSPQPLRRLRTRVAYTDRAGGMMDPRYNQQQLISSLNAEVVDTGRGAGWPAVAAPGRQPLHNRPALQSPGLHASPRSALHRDLPGSLPRDLPNRGALLQPAAKHSGRSDHHPIGSCCFPPRLPLLPLLCLLPQPSLPPSKAAPLLPGLCLLAPFHPRLRTLPPAVPPTLGCAPPAAGALVGSIEDQLGAVREQGRVLASEMLALKAEAEKKVAGLAVSCWGVLAGLPDRSLGCSASAVGFGVCWLVWQGALGCSASAGGAGVLCLGGGFWGVLGSVLGRPCYRFGTRPGADKRRGRAGGEDCGGYGQGARLAWPCNAALSTPA
jgi:hypothetical protein